MEQTLFISDAAKKVHVEAHVLRYWEEELELPIKRNELGHRYYTEEDVKRFQEIRELKERGLQLKAIRLILKNGKLDRLADGENTQAEKAAEAAKIAEKTSSAAKTAEKMPADAQHGKKNVEVLKTAEKVTGEVEPIKTTSVVGEESGEEKAARLQWLLKQLFREVLQENNEAVCREVRESILKEMDYQFRMQEEREDEREAAQIKRDEEHFRRVDELLRKKRGLLWNKDDRKTERKRNKTKRRVWKRDRKKKEKKQKENRKARRMPPKKAQKKSRSFCNSNGTDSGAVFGQTDVSAVFRWAGVSAAAAEGFRHRNSSRNRQGRE